MKEIGPPMADVGVIVGRFQVHELHQAHKDLIKYVIDRHDRVLIFLGMSQCRVTRNNPLDFESRKRMIQDLFPDVGINYLHDYRSDSQWSSQLDKMIHTHSKPGASVLLYGGRDAFIKHYTGKFECKELSQESYVSGTTIRKAIGNTVPRTADFRAGAVWAVHNQYPHTIPTVDVAIWNEKRTSLLMARKPNEKRFRFIGGFATGPTFEADARREVSEEAHIEITDPVYVGSHQVDDWRYRTEVDKIVTTLFEANYMSGKPTPDDDIEELKWFQLDELRDDDLVPEHHPLLEMLRCKKEKKDED